MNDTGSGPDLFNDLAHEFAECWRRGERPTASAYAAKYPELAEQIRDLFPALMIVEEFGSVDGAGPGGAGSATAVAPPRQLGEYRVLRQVGRGGMGVVYEAVQESLGRHVALKVLPYNTLVSAEHLERFRREARAAARLHHTHIVPVFGVGEHEGIHYYAMQFIIGHGLDQVLHEVRRLRDSRSAHKPTTVTHSLAASVAYGLLTGRGGDNQHRDPSSIPSAAGAIRDTLPYRSPMPADRPGEGMPTPLAPVAAQDASPTPGSVSDLAGPPGTSYYRRVADLGVQVAEALEYAHGQGILHRDIKPSNLLLDTAGQVWVTDFGLAKTEGSEDLTNTGALVGTVPYMAPERFQGSADARSDVYSLGITLYELLTLCPAFNDSQQARLIERVTHADPPTPRRLAPDMPRDLETIVLKAMAKEPARRYAYAAELAADLKRFLEHRPIHARRVSAAERLWRWRARNPLVASLAATIFLLLAVMTVGVSIQNARLMTSNREANAKLWESLRERARALRLSHHVGQRIEALRSIAEAMRLPLPPGHTLDELRTEAVAALALPDIEFVRDLPESLTPGLIDTAFDGNMEQYAQLQVDGTVTVRRISDDSLVAQWKETIEKGVEGGFQFSRDGRYVGLYHDDAQRLVVRRLEGPEPVVCCCLEKASPVFDFSPDGAKLACALRNEGIAVVDLASGQARHIPHTGVNRSIDLAPDGRRFAIAVARAGKFAVEVGDLATGQIQVTLPHPAWVSSIQGWHPDGQTLVTCCDDQMIRIWDVPSGKAVRADPAPFRTLEGHKARGIYCSFDSTGRRLLSNDWDGILRIWEASSGRQLLALPAGGYTYRRISSSDRFLATSTSDVTKVQLLRLHGRLEYQTAVVGSDVGFSDGAVHPEGRLLAVARSGSVVLMDLATTREVANVLPRERPAWPTWESSGALLTCEQWGPYRWPMHPNPLAEGHYQVGPPEGWNGNRRAYQFGASLDGQTLALVEVNLGALVLHRGPPIRTVSLQPHQNVRSCAVSPDGRYVATGSHTAGMGAKVWEADTGRLVKVLPVTGPCSVTFSRDGGWLLTTGGGCRLWAVGPWTEGPAVGGPFGCFSPDGSMVAVEDTAGAIRLVATDTGAEVLRLEAPEQTRLRPRCFTPDGTRLLATGRDTQAVHIWDLREIRRGLDELGLDWDNSEWPAYPPLTAKEAAERRGTSPPPQVTVDLGKLSDAEGNDLGAINIQAWDLANRPDAKADDLARAIQLSHRALTMSARWYSCWNTLGVAHYRAGHWNDAIAALSKAMEYADGEHESFNTFFLAMAHWRLGDKDKARQWYDRAVDWLEKNKQLLGDDLLELRRFHAEAEELLGSK
jgi:serine/threonine protein kinase/WD40 repeat protein